MISVPRIPCMTRAIIYDCELDPSQHSVAAASCPARQSLRSPVRGRAAGPSRQQGCGRADHRRRRGDLRGVRGRVDWRADARRRLRGRTAAEASTALCERAQQGEAGSRDTDEQIGGAGAGALTVATTPGSASGPCEVEREVGAAAGRRGPKLSTSGRVPLASRFSSFTSPATSFARAPSGCRCRCTLCFTRLLTYHFLLKSNLLWYWLVPLGPFPNIIKTLLIYAPLPSQWPVTY